MRRPSILKALLFVLLTCLTAITFGQGDSDPGRPMPANEKKVKPYKILTSGKQITIQSKLDIKSVMAWTANGNRFVEQKDIDNSTFKFNVVGNVKIFFLHFVMADGKRYTEKLGIQ